MRSASGHGAPAFDAGRRRCYKRVIHRLPAALFALFCLGAASGEPAFAQQGSVAAGQSRLDFDTFKDRVLPILTSARKGNARCVACHSRGTAISFLEPLSPGAAVYTDEQARRNFERIQRVVVPGEPEKSLLLMNPLAEEAGGSHWHGGGKHWSSQENQEWQTLATWVRTTAQPKGDRALDYEMFKSRVQPILISARKGNARCIACHARGTGISFLEPLAPGATAFTDEQARRNFERIQRVVVPGQPEKSLLLMNPLAEEAGGSHWHGGGKHWASQSDAEFQTLLTWVRGRN